MESDKRDLKKNTRVVKQRVNHAEAQEVNNDSRSSRVAKTKQADKDVVVVETKRTNSKSRSESAQPSNTRTETKSKTKTKSKTRSKEPRVDIESDEPIEINQTKNIRVRAKKNVKSEVHSTVGDTDSNDSSHNSDVGGAADGVVGETGGNRKHTISNLLTSYDPEDEKRKDAEEEILNESNFRLAVKPLNTKFQVVWDLYKKQHEAHWTAEEIDFSNDRHDFAKVDKNIQHFIKRILAFFAGADSIVNINIRTKFSKITVKEAEIAYGFQQMMENIHGEVYADMLINIITDPNERDELINAFKNVGSIKKMIQWAQSWINSERRIAFSIVVFCIFEGLMFSGAFAAIYWLKKILGEDKMKGLTQSNNLIAKDEGMHTNFGCVMYDYIVHRLTQEEITELMTEAVGICKEFTTDAIRVDMIGMNVELMHDYIEYVADRLMVYLGYKKIFLTKIPDQFQFMDTIGFLNKDNFFERRATEYQKAYNDRNRADWRFKILSEY